jgi:hypothetical protein
MVPTRSTIASTAMRSTAFDAGRSGAWPMIALATDRGAPARKPTLALEFEPGAGWCVRARGLRANLVASLGGRLASLLRVCVAEAADDRDLPNVLGDHEVLSDGLRFIPRYPFEPGVPFRAVLDLRALEPPGLAEVQTLEFSLPKEEHGPDAEVSEVFPSGEVLPENLLRFYIRFSQPMQRGKAQANIEVLGPDGLPAPDVLYRAPVELWDPSMTCLTILLDPGRLKRGVGPNRALGSPLRSGERYTLAIAPGMVDVRGRQLREGFRKPFRVADAIREPIAFERWRIRVPREATHEPLELTFPNPLDWAQLWRGIAIASGSGQPIGGRIDIDRGETRWRFTPAAPWRAGAYDARVAAGLEDPCGNTLYGPFDGPFRSADDIALETAGRSIRFVVEAAWRPANAIGAEGPDFALWSAECGVIPRPPARAT